jgi:hypothetical protein
MPKSITTLRTELQEHFECSFDWLLIEWTLTDLIDTETTENMTASSIRPPAFALVTHSANRFVVDPTSTGSATNDENDAEAARFD